MKRFTCPEEYNDYSHDPKDLKVFMAGGITGCKDWQTDVIKSYMNRTNLALFNPRRRDFDINDTGSSKIQIDWEWRHLNIADVIVFWFPREGKCMITLFELGWALGAGKKVIVGCHPEYERAFDVHEQVKLRAPWIKIESSLSDTYAQLLGE